MRSSSLQVLLPLVISSSLPGCAISLDRPPPMPDAAATLPVASGCLLFQQGSPSVTLLQGAGRSLQRASGAVLWSFEGATLTGGGSVTGGIAAVVSGDDPGRCFPATALGGQPAFQPAPLAGGDIVTPLDMVEVSGVVWSYYQLFQLDATAAFGVRSVGFGVARRDDVSGQFQPGANLLWAGDGPAFGTSALLLGGQVYVYGCGAPPGSTSSACYAARVPAASIDDPGAYEYVLGAGSFSPEVSRAAPILDGPGSVSVRQHASGRILATYAPPLDSRVVVRSALGPAGPFSREYPLAACALGPGDLCTGGVRHPELEQDPAMVAISAGAGSFHGTSPGSRYWPRLAVVPLPAGLP